MQYCSLQHQTLLSPPDTSTTEHHFCFGPAASFFLELLVIVLHFSPGAQGRLSELRGSGERGGWSSSFVVLSFCLFVQFMGSSQQEYWNGLPFPPPVEHILSELSTVTHWSSVTLHSLAVSFIELHKPLHHGKAVIHEGGCSHRSLKSQNQQNKLFIKKKMDAASSET